MFVFWMNLRVKILNFKPFFLIIISNLYQVLWQIMQILLMLWYTDQPLLSTTSLDCHHKLIDVARSVSWFPRPNDFAMLQRLDTILTNKSRNASLSTVAKVYNILKTISTTSTIV